jgi:hypothetical protein
MQVRLLPPYAVAQQTIVANGRAYSGVPGMAIDAPDFDAGVLAANGWTRIAFSGPTSARPTTSQANGMYGVAAQGMPFLDTTLDMLTVFDGAAWRNPATGAAI